MLICSGCAQPTPVRYENDAVRSLMAHLQSANAGLEAFKGRGRVAVTADGERNLFGRTVWAGAEPGRLRFTFLAPTGMPVISMSCDGEWVTALNHGDGDIYRRRIGGNSLSGFLPVSVGCADLYGLLSGRPPGVSYDSVRLDADAADGEGIMTLLLQRRFRGTVGRLQVDRETGDLLMVELLDVHGNRLYEARLEDRQAVDGYALPSRITLSGPDGRLELEVLEVWPQAAVDDALFRIAPQRPKGSE